MRAKININFESDRWEGIVVHQPRYESNVSNLSRVTIADGDGYKGFQLSQDYDCPVSALGGTDKVFSTSGYPGVLFDSLADSSGNFVDNIPSIDCYATYEENINTDVLYLEFDKITGQHATLVQIISLSFVTPIVISNDSPVMMIDAYETMGMPFSALGDFSLRILQWSQPHASAKITYASFKPNGTFTSRDIIDFKCSENIYDEKLKIQPGIIEQYADLAIYDRYNLLHNLARRGLLSRDKSYEVVCSVTDQAENTHVLGSYIAYTFEVVNDRTEVVIICNDYVDCLKSIYIKDTDVQKRSLHDMLVLVFSYVPFISWRYYDQRTQAECQSMCTPNHFFRKNRSVYDILVSICNAGFLRIYQNKNTFIVEFIQ